MRLPMRQRMLQLADNGFLRRSILRRADRAAGDFQADLPAAQRMAACASD